MVVALARMERGAVAYNADKNGEGDAKKISEVVAPSSEAAGKDS